MANNTHTLAIIKCLSYIKKDTSSHLSFKKIHHQVQKLISCNFEHLKLSLYLIKGESVKKGILFFDLDTQHDFMRAEGSLYVPGAEGIIQNVSKARRFAFDNGYSILASTDWHDLENPEISDSPDFKDTFPPHCMAGKPGSERVGDLGKLPIDVVPLEPLSDAELHKLIDKKQFHIVIRKNEIDVFSNTNTERIIEILKPKAIIIFGVALDFCVRMALEQLLKRPGIKTYLLQDAVKGLGNIPDDEIINKFKAGGVEIISTSDLRKNIQ